MVAVDALSQTFGGSARSGDDAIEQAGGVDARVVDGLAIGAMVAAVDAASGEIDADVGAFEVLGPGADALRHPSERSARERRRGRA